MTLVKEIEGQVGYKRARWLDHIRAGLLLRAH